MKEQRSESWQEEREREREREAGEEGKMKVGGGEK